MRLNFFGGNAPLLLLELYLFFFYATKNSLTTENGSRLQSGKNPWKSSEHLSTRNHVHFVPVHLEEITCVFQVGFCSLNVFPKGTVSRRRWLLIALNVPISEANAHRCFETWRFWHLQRICGLRPLLVI